MSNPSHPQVAAAALAFQNAAKALQAAICGAYFVLKSASNDDLKKLAPSQLLRLIRVKCAIAAVNCNREKLSSIGLRL